jgi:hypothetical protein
MLPRIRTLAILAALAGVASTASATPAGAAVTLGQAGFPPGTCGGNVYLAQTAVAGPPGYTVPGGYGVMTSWSAQGAAAPGVGKLLVWRPTGTTNQYILLRKSFAEAFTTGIVRSYPVRFPVEPGDILGLMTNQNCLAGGSPGDVAQYATIVTDPAEGSVQTLSNVIPQSRIMLSAQVEPDADHDGFGDETQDQCPTNAALQGPCPGTAATAATGQRALALEKCRKKHSKKARKKCRRKAKLLPL